MRTFPVPRSQFAETVRRVQDDIAIYARIEKAEPSLSFVLKLFLLTAGFQFVFVRRLQEALALLPLVGRPIRRVVWWLSCLLFGSEIALAAEIGGGLYVPHPYGIVVGRCRLGRNLVLQQGVTIGNRGVTDTGAPAIGDDCALGAGCAVLGDVTIGDGVQVGANSVVVRDVGSHVTVVGIPARVIVPRSASAPAIDEPGLVPTAL